MSPPLATAVFFTCARDRPWVELAAKQVTRAGIPVRLAIDTTDQAAFAPNPAPLITTFPRHGNLNGMPCLLGILTTMRNLSAHTEWVVKIDSDTIPLPSFWTALQDPTLDAVGTRQPGREWCGACYAIRSRRLPALIQLAQAQPRYATCSEDLMLYRILRFTDWRLHRLALGWWNNRENLPPRQRCDVVTFGWMEDLPANLPTARRRELVTSHLASFTR